MSFTRYVDLGLVPGTSYTYTVRMRDKNGNTTARSTSLSAVTRISSAPTGEFAYGPAGISNSAITMTAEKLSSPSGLVEYRFTRNDAVNSGWQASPSWTDTNVIANADYTYTVQARDGRGNVGTASALRPATAKDMAPPKLPVPVAQWEMQPYATIDNKVSMTASAPADGSSGVQYQFTCVSGGERLVTFATVTVLADLPSYSISGRVTDLLGAGISGATVYVSNQPDASANPGFTATTDTSGNYSRTVPEGIWYVAAGSANHNTSPDQLVAVTGANVPNTNFTLVGNVEMSGQVTRKSDGAPISGATVYFSRSTNPSGNPVHTATTNGSGNYAHSVQDGTWYVAAIATGFFASQEQEATVAGANVTGINFQLTSDVRDIPSTSNLIFGAVTDSLPASGPAGSWPTLYPAGQTMTPEGSPTMEMIDGVKWVRGYYDRGDGFDKGYYGSAISCNGASIVVVVKPARNSQGTSWTSCVDVFYDRLLLGVRNSTGRVDVRRNGSFNQSAAAIPDGQKTVLSLVVQPDGTFKVWANGTEIMNIANTSAMTSLVPGVAGGYANHINVGRNDPDGWTTFNGNIGDVFLYDIALSDAERLQLEGDLYAKFGIGTTGNYTVTATAGEGGTISPSGSVMVAPGANQAFTITPQADYAIEDVKVDGVSVGAVADHTFNSVAANHTISATFTQATHTITASAGPNGTIEPSGPVALDYTTEQIFTIIPAVGYAIEDVLVDSESVGAIDTCSFVHVSTDHTIHADFRAIPFPHTITASAGPNGTISPNGAALVSDGANQSITMTADEGYAINDVLVDGVSVGPLGDFNFIDVTSDHTISVTFKSVLPVTDVTYTITASACAGGSISPSGSVIVIEGASQTFLIMPEADYEIDDVIVDDVSVGAVESYTFDDVTDDHTISVTFTEKEVNTVPVWIVR